MIAASSWFLRLRNGILRNLLRLTLNPRKPRVALERLGDADGSWIIPVHLLDEHSTCYCIGVGENITFDLGLIRKLGCKVHAFDPTPRAKRHVQTAAKDLSNYHFHGIGVWNNDERVRFYAPRNPSHVSHSALNLQRTTDFFEADCKSLSSIMQDLRHERLDLLKLDIEGAEHLVIESILADNIEVRILCVEFDQPMPLKRLIKTLRRLRSADYRILSIDRWNFTFVHTRDSLTGTELVLPEPIQE